MIDHLAVVVPARDEQALMAACLDALLVAAGYLRRTMPAPPSTEIVVVLDDCRDGTAEVVADYPGIRAVATDRRCVGAARALGTDRALRGHRSLTGVWTAHTDADSAVPATWLTHMVRAADRGYDLVLGTVTPGIGLPWPARQAWHAMHSTGDGHEHVHGANLGIRASTLRLAGGWRPMPTGEDVDLAGRAIAVGARVQRTGAVAVRTSARADGRAPMGFSSFLRTLTPVAEGTFG